MLKRLSMITFALTCCFAFAPAVHSQETAVQEQAVNYDNGPLYAWPAWVSITTTGSPVFVGEVLTSTPFNLVQDGQVQPGTVTTNMAPAIPQPTSGNFTGSVNLPVFPSPGGC